jgi:hypothetical protein
MPHGWRNPKHPPWLSQVLLNNVRRGGTADRARLARLLPTLHNLRVTADYRPQILVDAAEARLMLHLCKQAHDVLATIRR